MSEKTAVDVLRMMELVTRGEGTAPMARVSGYRVAGKTGTAHKFVNGSYDGSNYISSFVGLAPASDPRLVVAVMLDEPHSRKYYGGLVAAPVFSKVMAGALRFMALPPDAPFDSSSAPPAKRRWCRSPPLWRRQHDAGHRTGRHPARPRPGRAQPQRRQPADRSGRCLPGLPRRRT
jgi:membrane peptidoglycan carboxypeptidase